jgi:hypothetical protein
MIPKSITAPKREYKKPHKKLTFSVLCGFVVEMQGNPYNHPKPHNYYIAHAYMCL